MRSSRVPARILKFEGPLNPSSCPRSWGYGGSPYSTFSGVGLVHHFVSAPHAPPRHPSWARDSYRQHLAQPPPQCPSRRDLLQSSPSAPSPTIPRSGLSPGSATSSGPPQCLSPNQRLHAWPPRLLARWLIARLLPAACDLLLVAGGRGLSRSPVQPPGSGNLVLVVDACYESTLLVPSDLRRPLPPAIGG